MSAAALQRPDRPFTRVIVWLSPMVSDDYGALRSLEPVAHVEDRWERADRKGSGKRWRVRYLDPAGTERSKSFGLKTEATKFMNETAADVERGTWADPAAGKLTLRQYVTGTYLPAQTTEATSQQSTESRFRTRILPSLGSKTLGQLAATPSVIQAWAAGLRGELSDSYVRGLLVALSGALNAAVTDGLISRNPCSLVKPPKAARARVQPWTGQQVAAVREALPERYAVLADLGSGLGLRQGEAFGLAVEDVDFLRRVVHIRRQVRITGSTMTFAPPKGGKERDVPLAESIALRLAAHIAAFPPAAVSLPWKTPEGRPQAARLLVTTPQGRPVHRSNFNISYWQPALRAAGIAAGRENGMHALRHYYASALLARGVDIRALSEYLGHSDPGFTLRVYTHLMPDADDRARQAVDAAFSGSDGPATAQGGAK
jgi:integrase